MVLNAQIRLSVEEYTALHQIARREGKNIQELLAQRFQDLVEGEIEAFLGGTEHDGTAKRQQS